MADTYDVLGHCRNCQERHIGRFLKGERTYTLAECPHCGCHTAYYTSSRAAIEDGLGLRVVDHAARQRDWKRRRAGGVA
jgi:rRNA maturation protein Nop10